MVTQDCSSFEEDRPTTKEIAFNPEPLFEPVRKVPTAVGTIYLYELSLSDIIAFSSLSGRNPIERIRSFLPHIASLVEAEGSKDERPPLTTEEVGQLSDVEVEKIASTYAEVLNCEPRVADDRGANKLVRESGESATAYLDRRMKQNAQELFQKPGGISGKISTPASKLFDHVRKSASVLGGVLNAYEKSTRIEVPTVPDIEPMPAVDFGALDRLGSERARMRAQESAERLELAREARELARETRDVTAASGRMLKDLVEAAATLMEQMEERDKKSDQSMRKQLSIAVWSVGVSAVLALLSLVVSGLAYFQDRDNNISGDKWQEELIAAVRDGSRQRDMAEVEVQRLRGEVAELKARLVHIESAPNADSIVNKRAASTVRPPATPRTTLRSP